LKTIEDRSKGLLSFVGTFKNLTRIPKPSFTNVHVADLLNHIKTLMKQELDKKNIQLTISLKNKDIQIHADHEQIEQVLINLIINSLDVLAGKNDGSIEIIASQDLNNKIFIRIIDNGPGIDKENIDKIFIPFYTTKKKGSGIGLSLSRQIMRLHKGSISVKSIPGKGAEFILEF